MLRRGGFHKNIRALFPEVDFQDDTFAGLFYFALVVIVVNFDVRSSGRQCQKSLFCELCEEERLRSLDP